MNGAHWHLLVNHFPVVLQSVALPIVIYGTVRKQTVVQHVGLVLLIAAALFTGISYGTGEAAEDALKNYPEITEASIDTHAMAADWALRSAALVGGFSLFLLVRSVMGRTQSKGWWIGHAVLALWALSVVAMTSHHGGAIRHPEIDVNGAHADHAQP